MPNLTLAPRYSLALALTGDGGSLTLDTSSDALSLALQTALRGEAGYGLLGASSVTPGQAIDISARVGCFKLALGADQALAFTGGTAALDRKRFLLEVTQVAPGGFMLTADAASVGLGPDLPAIELSTAPGVTDALGFVYRTETGKCHYLGINHGST